MVLISTAWIWVRAWAPGCLQSHPQSQQDGDQPLSGGFAPLMPGETPGETPLTSKVAERAHTRRDKGEARRTDGCIVQQKGEIRLFWIYRGFDLAKRMLNQITTINVYELPTSS